jgi:hypothetical protein
VLENPVPALSEVVADLPPALVEAISRATAKEPSKRFPTALDFARELEKSVSLVPNHLVGQWVRDTAGPSLEAKRARVRAIEAFELPADGEPLSLPPARLSTPSASYERAAPDEVTRAENPVTVATRADRVQRPVLAVSALVVVALGAVMGGLWFRGRGAEVRTDGRTEAAATAPPAEPARPASEAMSPPPASSVAPLAPPASTEEARPAASPAVSSTPKASSRKRGTPRPKPTPPRKPESLFSRE